MRSYLAGPAEDEIDGIGERLIALREDLLEIDEVKAFVDIAHEKRDKDQQSHREQ